MTLGEADRSRVLGLLAEYCHAVDDQDLESLADLFTPGAVLSAGGREFHGRERVVSVIGRSLAAAPTGKHLCANVVLEPAGGTVQVLSDFVALSPQGAVMAMGRYHDRVVLGDDRARLERREIIRTFG